MRIRLPRWRYLQGFSEYSGHSELGEMLGMYRLRRHLPGTIHFPAANQGWKRIRHIALRIATFPQSRGQSRVDGSLWKRSWGGDCCESHIPG
jgi:hypothetical protein